MPNTKHTLQMQDRPAVGVYYTEPEKKKRARQLAEQLTLPLVTSPSEARFTLSFHEEKLTLSLSGDQKKRSRTLRIWAEFIRGSAGYRRHRGGRELLLRAIGFTSQSPPLVLDATGGLGTDAFLMASHGCNVQILERSAIVAALLEDGLERAAHHPATSKTADRMHLFPEDSRLFFRRIAAGHETMPDVIYLDPMFPERSKSALVKKEMQLLQKLLGEENDQEELFTAALEAGAGRVVVKRPRSAHPLGLRKPSHSLKGKTTRFDVYLP